MDDIAAMQTTLTLLHHPGYRALSAVQQRMVMASYTLRSLSLLELFDRRYDQRLAGLFCRGLSVYVAGSLHEYSTLHAEIEAHIPDTDVFGEQEAAYAQNAFIALFYLMEATPDDDPASLERSIDMTLQNVDLLYYERNPDYRQVILDVAEQQVFNSLLEQAAATDPAVPVTFESISALASAHWL